MQVLAILEVLAICRFSPPCKANHCYKDSSDKLEGLQWETGYKYNIVCKSQATETRNWDPGPIHSSWGGALCGGCWGAGGPPPHPPPTPFSARFPAYTGPHPSAEPTSPPLSSGGDGCSCPPFPLFGQCVYLKIIKLYVLISNLQVD